MSRIVDLALEIDKELEGHKHMIMELHSQINQEKECRRKLLKKIRELLQEFEGEI